MIHLSSKNVDSSLCYDVIIIPQKITKIGTFCDFSSDIDFNSETNIFRDVISLIINQCDPRRPKCASGGHCVRQPRSERVNKLL